MLRLSFAARAAVLGALAAVSLPACDERPRRQPPEPVKEALPDGRPSLVVLLVVDQLRGDEIESYRGLWAHGMAELLRGGRWYSQAMHGHARTETASGHATIATGVHPRVHGVVDKLVFDRAAGRMVPVCGDDADACEPDMLLVPTLGDRLKAVSPRSKVVSIALKDRSATLLGGREADVVAWLGHSPLRVEGRAVGGGIPGWMQDVVHRHTRGDALQSSWALPALPSALTLRADRHEDEIDPGYGTTFPHLLPPRPSADDVPVAWFYMPQADRVVLELALETVGRLELGRGDQPDLLLVSLGTVDYIGHNFGPDSLERTVILRELDVMLGAFLRRLGALVPHTTPLVLLTSDHGVAPTVQHARRRGFASGRISADTLQAYVESALQARFGGGPYIAALWPPFVTLRRLPAQRRAEVQELVRGILQDHPAVREAHVVSELRGDAAADTVDRLLYETAHPERAGDIAFAFEPYFNVLTKRQGDGGALHGTPWPYDRHVPVIFHGSGVAAGRVDEPALVIDAIQTLGQKLGLPLEPRSGRVLY